MIQVDERTKELFVWATRFAAIRLHADDVRHPIQAHVKKIVDHIHQQPDLSGASDDEVRTIGADRAQMIRDLDYLRVSAVAVATSATLEQAHEASREHGAEGGKKFGFKGGRPSKKPTRAEIRKAYDAYLTCGSTSEARANLAKDLRKTGVSERTVRDWLKDAGIP